MRLRPKTLSVYANPWGISPRVVADVRERRKKDPKATVAIDPNLATIDHNGLPAGACPCDPNEHDPTRGNCVGSIVDPDHTVVTQKLGRGDDLRDPLQVTVRTYHGVPATDPELGTKLAAADPVTIPYTAFYVDKLSSGELLAADEATAKAAGIDFVDPKTLIPEIERLGIEAWNRHFDDVPGGAFAQFQKERAEKAPKKPEEAKPAETKTNPRASESPPSRLTGPDRTDR